MKDALPFVLANAFILVQPVFDRVWMRHWEKEMRAKESNLEGAAEWVASVSAFFPSSVVTIYGAALLVDGTDEKDKLWLVTALIVLIVISVGLYLNAALQHSMDRAPRLRFWSHLQVWLFFLNLLGVWAASKI